MIRSNYVIHFFLVLVQALCVTISKFPPTKEISFKMSKVKLFSCCLWKMGVTFIFLIVGKPTMISQR